MFFEKLPMIPTVSSLLPIDLTIQPTSYYSSSLTVLVMLMICFTTYNLFSIQLNFPQSQNIGAIKDIFVIKVSSSMFLLFFFMIQYTSASAGILFIKICLIGSLILYLSTLFWLMGVQFIVYVKGVADSLSLVYNLVIDFINLISFSVRLLIQLLRFIILYSCTYMYELLWFELKISTMAKVAPKTY